jgi:WD40 repeat protein
VAGVLAGWVALLVFDFFDDLLAPRNPPPPVEVNAGVANPPAPAWNPPPQPDPRPPQPVPLVTIEVGGFLNRFDLSRDGKTLVTAVAGTVRRWDVATGQPLGKPCVHLREVYGVAFSPDGGLIATGSGDGKARLWDAKTDTLRTEFLAQGGNVGRVAFSPDGALLAAHSDEAFRMWDVSTGKERARCEGSRGAAPVFGISNVAFSTDGKRIAAGDQANTVKVWDAPTGALKHTLAGHGREALAVGFSPDGKLLATGSYDATVRLWDAATFAEVASFPADGQLISNVAFSPDGRLLATSGQDRLILWDVAARKAICSLEGGGTPAGAAFSGDGAVLACGWRAQALRVWDVRQLLARP